MPSPFPGMDPYLEGSEWGSFRCQFVAELARMLAPVIRPKYVALMGRREIFSISGHIDESLEAAIFGPARAADVSEGDAADRGASRGGQGGPARRVRTVIGQPSQHYFVDVRDTKRRRLVTRIEVLSSINKSGDGYAEYLGKRNRLLRGRAHLLEIDLQRAGRRPPMRDPLPATPHFAFLCRAGKRPVTEVWPIPDGRPLPVVPVPLAGSDPDVPLDLQVAFNAVYDIIGYQHALDYRRRPPVTLGPAVLNWVRGRLDAAGVPQWGG